MAWENALDRLLLKQVHLTEKGELRALDVQQQILDTWNMSSGRPQTAFHLGYARALLGVDLPQPRAGDAASRWYTFGRLRGHDRCGERTWVADLIKDPIVLHGASAVREEDVALAERYGAHLPKATGVPEEFIKRSISLGVAKINTDSDLRLAALGRMRQVLTERPEIFNLYQLMGEVEEAIRETVEARIRLFGSDGKAA